MARISVAMLTRDETVEFRWLMEALAAARDAIDEIVVVDDFSGPEFVAAVREFEATLPLRFFQRALAKNFAAQRNYMKSLCRGRLIFFLDPHAASQPNQEFGPQAAALPHAHAVDFGRGADLTGISDRDVRIRDVGSIARIPHYVPRPDA